MGRQVDIEDLITSAEVAQLLGLSHRETVMTYLRRYDDFPRPVIEKTGGRLRLWLRQDIEEWASARRA